MAENAFIEELKRQYEESLDFIDNGLKQIIDSGDDMKALEQFDDRTERIAEVYEVTKQLYATVYRLQVVLNRFDSRKIHLKAIPLRSFYDEGTLTTDDAQQYLKETSGIIRRKFMNASREFDEEAYCDHLANTQLDELGYNREHWYFPDLYINELDFMLDFLLKFVEAKWGPTAPQGFLNRNLALACPRCCTT